MNGEFLDVSLAKMSKFTVFSNQNL